MATDEITTLNESVWRDWEGFDLGYNPQGATEKQKWASLNSFNLTINNSSYTAVLQYNHICKWVGIVVYNDTQEIVQQWTYLSKFPTNLLVASEFKEYGLFYIENYNQLFFGELPSGWYNSNIDYDEMYSYIKYKRIISN